MELYNNHQIDSIIYLDKQGIQRTERWRPISGYEEFYHVSDLGRVKSLEQKRFMQVNQTFGLYKERILNQSLTKEGYLKITLVKKQRKSFLSHRLVGQAFILNPENKPQINHLKGVKTDNRYWMLEWTNSHENIQHSYDNHLLKPKKGIKNGSAKLTEKEVLEIRSIGKSMSQKNLAIKYNVGTSTIGRILSRTHWKHI